MHVVIFTPDDINILKDGPAQRLRFLDIFISQLRPNYVYCLNMYLKAFIYLPYLYSRCCML